MARSVLPTHQARSWRTLERLLQATVRVLDTHGLEGATMPRIAAEARLTPGAIYRRFADKDALLREACLRVLRENARQSAILLAPETWAHAPLAALVRSIVTTTLAGHARHRGLLRAIMTFSLERADPAFLRESTELQRSVVQTVTGVILARRAEIGHPDPDSAVPFALLMVGVAARGVLTIPPDPKHLSRLVPDAEGRLERELPDMVLAYLRIADPPRGSRP